MQPPRPQSSEFSQECFGEWPLKGLLFKGPIFSPSRLYSIIFHFIPPPHPMCSCAAGPHILFPSKNPLCLQPHANTDALLDLPQIWKDTKRGSSGGRSQHRAGMWGHRHGRGISDLCDVTIGHFAELCVFSTRTLKGQRAKRGQFFTFQRSPLTGWRRFLVSKRW